MLRSGRIQTGGLITPDSRWTNMAKRSRQSHRMPPASRPSSRHSVASSRT